MDVFVTGDFNLDALKHASNQKVCDICLHLNFDPLIVETAHFTESSSSIIDLLFTSNKSRILLHYRLPICPFQIRVENAVKSQVICTEFSTQIPNSQSLLVTNNALNCSETHLPVYQSRQLIYCIALLLSHSL